MQRNPHSYQIATGYRTFYSLSLIYQPITKKRLFFIEKPLPDTVGQNIFVVIADVDVDRVVSVCTTDLLDPRQIHYFRMLA